MKASIDANGVLSVRGENPVEQYALKKWMDSYPYGESILKVGTEQSCLWIPWEGDRERPEDINLQTEVEVKFRDGETDRREVRFYDWSHTDDPEDIMAYRLA